MLNTFQTDFERYSENSWETSVILGILTKFVKMIGNVSITLRVIFGKSRKLVQDLWPIFVMENY